MDIDLKVCKELGVTAAVVHAVIKDACTRNGVSFEGHHFAKLSIREIHNRVPFISKRTITRMIKALEMNGFIESKLFVGRTKWRRTT